MNAANPVNLAKGLYYTVDGTSRALSFILIQSARFECYTELALKNPALAQKFLADYNADNQRVRETLDGIITHLQDEWEKMSGPERTEFIFKAITEFAAAPAFQASYLRCIDKTFKTVATHMQEALNKPPYAMTAEGIQVPMKKAEAMMQEAETSAQKGAKAADVVEQAQKAPPPVKATPSATGHSEQVKPASQVESGAAKADAAVKPATEAEKVVTAVKAETGIIRAYSDNPIKRDHIFSPDHRERGIYRLSKLPEAVEVEKDGAGIGKIIKETVENDILAKFQRIIEAVDAAGRLEEGTNIIRTTIDGFKVEIHVHIEKGKVFNIDGYLPHSGRKWHREIYWP